MHSLQHSVAWLEIIHCKVPWAKMFCLKDFKITRLLKTIMIYVLTPHINMGLENYIFSSWICM